MVENLSKFQVEISTLKFDENGLIPAIVQDGATKEVLMLAYMNKESLRQSLEIGQTVFFSRSRQSMWHKGATSGNVQRISRIEVDCDRDTLLIQVTPAGPACHRNTTTCFDRETTNDDQPS